MKSTAAWVWGGVGAVVIIGALWWAATASPAALKKPTTVADPITLPGMTTSTIPQGATTWGPDSANLEARLAADDMKPQTMEGQVLHIHQHLDLFIHGKVVPIPANIGINQAAGWLSAVHTHSEDGIIHVESPFKATYTLGEFFDIWGVAFTQKCIAGYCADANNLLAVYVNGKAYEGDPRQLALDPYAEIVVVYGTKAETPASIPSSFSFPEGY